MNTNVKLESIFKELSVFSELRLKDFKNCQMLCHIF